MSLIEEFMTACVLVNKTKIPDGEGGFTTTWAEGPEFQAAITMDTTMQARIAEKEGVTSVYTITTNKNTVLEYHEVVKRKSDGAIFRVTSNGVDKKTPGSSSLDISQVTAEKWELTT